MANPQSWNRYSYVTNRPINFNDPSGHRIEEGDGGACPIPGWCETNLLSYQIKKSKRSDFEKGALENLLKAGEEGLHVVDYIMENNVAIGFDSHLYAGAYWDDEDNALYLNMDEEDASADDPFVLNLIAHEVTHLEQTPTWALTKAGELEAWKVGFTVQNYFSPLTKGTPEYDIVHDLDIWDTDKFTELAHQYNNKTPRGWIYNFLFDLLPNYPPGIWVSTGGK